MTGPSHFSSLVLVLTSFPVLALADEGPAVHVVSKPEGGSCPVEDGRGELSLPLRHRSTIHRGDVPALTVKGS